ncbi:MAG: molybdopterin molybdotransferase MoeA [Actinobacteria bacterium]|nr:molybdopterin molybdotransferase MoeA [Actinomycetota bacterium]
MSPFRGLARTTVTEVGEPEPLEAYRDHVLTGVAPLPVEPVPVHDAIGRTLARDVAAGVDLPGFPNAAMDGYAVRAADVDTASGEHPVALDVAGEIAAGSPHLPELRAGTALRIMTGAPVPGGADTVIPVEVTTERDGTVFIHRAPRTGEHVRGIGEDVRAGQVVVVAGTRVNARILALLAAVGAVTVDCHRRARVVVLSTGDEVVPTGRALGPGQLYDSNGPMLVACATGEDAHAHARGPIADDPAVLRDALSEAAASADLVLVTGGVSAGRYDHLPEALASLGQTRTAKLAMKPGKPQVHARIGTTTVLGLPGNPVSAFVSFEMFAVPILRTLHGRRQLARPSLWATAARDLRGSARRRTFLRVRLRETSSGLEAEPCGGQGSHMLRALADADALAEVPADRPRIAEGEAVRVHLLSDQ